jgi:hypothetical protein
MSNTTQAMTEIEKIFEKYSTLFPIHEDTKNRNMNSEQFKQALAEVFQMVKVTDEEIDEQDTTYLDEPYFKESAKWSRDLQKNKIEKLLK